jgi:formate hydrogenlyase subunit 3/multisubunit Na+/H+ antiporter MnhD subunit
MAWLYFTICLFDFIVGPVLWAIIQQDAKTITQWVPLTSRGGGLFHMAMMAIVGITAWGRTQEKINMSPFGVEMQRDSFESYPSEKLNNKSPKNVDDEFEFEETPNKKSRQSRKT